MDAIEIDILKGHEVADWIDPIARLRVRVLREFPYLYDSDRETENNELRRYADAPCSVFVLAKVGQRMIGASYGFPLTTAREEILNPFQALSLDIASYFYFGASMLDPEFRGRGIGHMFIDAREAFAWQSGFSTTAFCSVERSAEHPKWPPGHRPLHEFWASHGYARKPDLNTFLSWTDVGDEEETLKPMTFWVKAPTA